ncbi:hypothetical protein P3S67_019649 [Capsicum chacoense]
MKQTSSLVDPNCSKRQLMILTNAVSFEGKIYALSLQGTLVVIEGIECKFQITKLSRSRAVQSVFSKHFKEYLLESNGEILLIFLISEHQLGRWTKWKCSSSGLIVVCGLMQVNWAAEATVSISLSMPLILGCFMIWEVLLFRPVLMIMVLKQKVQYGKSQ